RASELKLTASARAAGGALTLEVLIPPCQENSTILRGQRANTLQIGRAEAFRIDDLDRIQPQLRDRFRLADVHVRWLRPFIAEEVEPETIDDEQSRHAAHR